MNESRRDPHLGAQAMRNHRVPDGGKRSPGNHRCAERHDALPREQDDERKHRVEDLPREIDGLDPSIPLQTLEHADKGKRRQAEQGLRSEQDEQKVEVVLQVRTLQLREEVASDDGQRQQDRHGDDRCDGQHRQGRAHDLADALALSAPVGVGDESRHACLQPKVGDAQIAR